MYNKDIISSKIIVRTKIQPGDFGTLINLHARVYYDECGYDHVFEGYVAKTFYEFAINYSDKKDRMFMAEYEGKIIACVAIVGHSEKNAQLRWFLVLPEFRGLGLGKLLYQAALEYCREMNYSRIWLLTTSDQERAIAMYEKAGFRLIGKTPGTMWQADLMELEYELIG